MLLLPRKRMVEGDGYEDALFSVFCRVLTMSIEKTYAWRETVNICHLLQERRYTYSDGWKLKQACQLGQYPRER